jgi:hypothetical protein
MENIKIYTTLKTSLLPKREGVLVITGQLVTAKVKNIMKI